MEVSVIIVSWNVSELLKNCLSSLFKFNKDVSLEVIVVDNNSSDNTVEMLEREFPEVIVIKNLQNKGFAVANNQGLARAQGKYVLFLNPDTIFIENSIERLLPLVKEKETLVGCNLLNEDLSNQLSVRKDPKVLAFFLILLKLHNFFPNFKFLRDYFCLDFDYDKQQEVEQLMGAFMFMPRDLIEQIGGWDQNYPLLFEDVDLCKRIRSLGKRIYYTPITKVIHLKGQSFQKQLNTKNQINFNLGLLRYFYKQKNLLGVIMVLVMFLPSIILSYLVRFLPTSLKNTKL